MRVESVEAIAQCLYGDDLKETVIQLMAAELYKVIFIIGNYINFCFFLR